MSLTRPTQIQIDTPVAPPHWALLEWQLVRAQTAAIREYYAKYFDERGYLRCVPRWGGDDGPDDAAENQLNWTMLHALGASDEVLDLFKQGWEGHLRQYTEAKTVEVPFARDGMYYKEFPVMFDWFHHGESYSVFNLQGLSDPYDALYQQRTRRYATFYTAEDSPDDKYAGVSNYDPEHKVIRSMFNGSRGPLLRKATGLDWAGDPIEIEGRFHLGHGERSYDEMVAHFKDYNDIVGDNPLNLGATTFALNAYALAGEVLKETLSDLKKPLREALERLQGLSGPFSRREAREALGVPDSTVRRWLGELVELEYLAISEEGRQGAGRMTRYRLTERGPRSEATLGLLTPRELGAALR